VTGVTKSPSGSSARSKSTRPWCKTPQGIIIKDAIADITLQQVLTRPEDFDVIATLNLNGDYLSDALAAKWAASASRPRQHQLPERPRHFRGDARYAPEIRKPGPVNPGSVILSGEMMFRYLG